MKRMNIRSAGTAFGAVLLSSFLMFPMVHVPEVAAQSKGSFAQEWEALIAAAKQEGTLAIATGGAPSRQYRPTFDAFRKEFGIRVEVSSGGANDVANRILAERKAGRSPVDVALISTRINTLRFVPAKALMPMSELLFHPDVTDLSKWYGGKHWYADREQRYTLIYHASLEEDFRSWYNTKEISEEEIKTIKTQWDFFDPKWKGKIQGQAMNDPSGVRQMMDAWFEPDRGPEWVKKYLTGADITFSPDRRVLENWLVGGRFPLWAVTTASEELRTLEEKGLPIKQYSLPRKVGILRAAGSGCCISVFDGAPHPNAAKLFVNWFLTKDVQTLTHETIANMDRASLREDVPRGQVTEEHMRKPGKEYHFPDADPESGERFRMAQDEVMKIWGSRQKR